MKNIIITKEILHIWDEYHQDFGLLDERWASESDGQKVSLEQSMLFSEYIHNLLLLKLDGYSVEMKERASHRISEIENVMDDEVVKILRQRFLD